MSAFGDSAVSAAKSDTLRFTLLSSLDQAATSPTNYGEVQLDSLSLKIRFAKYDYTPSSVVATDSTSTSILVTWLDRSDTETGFALVNAYTGARIGGNDSTAAGIEFKYMTGLTPNTKYNIAIKVLGGKIAGDVSAASDSCYTDAAAPGLPTVTFPADSLMKFVVNVNGNPSYTEFAIQDSITGKYVYAITGPDTFGTAAWWGTFTEYGGSAGDTVAVGVGKKYTLRAKSKSGE